MNPEENNPLANPGVPNFGASSGQMNALGNDQMTNDNFAMAGDSLTSAGMAAGPTMPQPVSFNSGAAPTGDNLGLPPVEEPLVPADPVPGSIGSVTSVPAEPLANPFAMRGEAQSGAMPAPEVQPQPAPYNPFAQPAGGVNAMGGVEASAAQSTTPEPAKPLMTPAKDTVNPTFQPAPTASHAKTKSLRSISPLDAILAIVCAILLITTITFAALYINAKNNPKVVYVPATADGESNAQINLLSCSRNEDMNWLSNDAYTVPVVRTYSFSFSGDKFSTFSDEYQMTFENEADAVAGQDIFNNNHIASLPIEVSAEYNVNGNTLNANIVPAEDPVQEVTAQTYLYGSADEAVALTQANVQSFLEGAGFVCSVE